MYYRKTHIFVRTLSINKLYFTPNYIFVLSIAKRGNLSTEGNKYRYKALFILKVSEMLISTFQTEALKQQNQSKPK